MKGESSDDEFEDCNYEDEFLYLPQEAEPQSPASPKYQESKYISNISIVIGVLVNKFQIESFFIVQTYSILRRNLRQNWKMARQNNNRQYNNKMQ